jgi:hypothetical protein
MAVWSSHSSPFQTYQTLDLVYFRSHLEEDNSIRLLESIRQIAILFRDVAPMGTAVDPDP